MAKHPFVTKICPDCKIDKPRSDYYKKGVGVSFRCKVCTGIVNRARAPRYFGKYGEYQNQWRKNRYATDPAYREKIKLAKAVNKDANNSARRKAWATNPSCSARLHYRRKDVKTRTPSWVGKAELLAVYAGCPRGMEVDHIIPLKGLIDGRPVSGLHVPWNLQYLTVAANRRKKNRITETDISHLVVKR